MVIYLLFVYYALLGYQKADNILSVLLHDENKIDISFKDGLLQLAVSDIEAIRQGRYGYKICYTGGAFEITLNRRSAAFLLTLLRLNPNISIKGYLRSAMERYNW